MEMMGGGVSEQRADAALRASHGDLERALGQLMASAPAPSPAYVPAGAPPPAAESPLRFVPDPYVVRSMVEDFGCEQGDAEAALAATQGDRMAALQLIL